MLARQDPQLLLPIERRVIAYKYMMWKEYGVYEVQRNIKGRSNESATLNEQKKLPMTPIRFF